ncbi:uncharacterized protein LOC119333900 [Triticum dicoccoides]|uniref:uncharacterized protein LOC119333900 n=1 Tax=Triticum dicoccoides TaxID=85692 RepID=UPI0018910136|nr:uncharacterized protein LOC119333900 [Triticum dicoccoides]
MFDAVKSSWPRPLFNAIKVPAAWNIWKQRNICYFDKITASLYDWKRALKANLENLKFRVNPELVSFLDSFIPNLSLRFCSTFLGTLQNFYGFRFFPSLTYSPTHPVASSRSFPSLTHSTKSLSRVGDAPPPHSRRRINRVAALLLRRRRRAFSSASPLPLACILSATVEPKLDILARSSRSVRSAGTTALSCSRKAATDASAPRRHRPARRSAVLDVAISDAAGTPPPLRVPCHLHPDVLWSRTALCRGSRLERLLLPLPLADSGMSTFLEWICISES